MHWSYHSSMLQEMLNGDISWKVMQNDNSWIDLHGFTAFDVFDIAFLWRQYELDSETIQKGIFCTPCCLCLDATPRFGNGELKHLEEELQKQLDAHPDDMSCYVCQSDTLIKTVRERQIFSRFGVTWWFGTFTKCCDASKCWYNADIILYIHIII